MAKFKIHDNSEDCVFKYHVEQLDGENSHADVCEDPASCCGRGHIYNLGSGITKELIDHIVEELFFAYEDDECLVYDSESAEMDGYYLAQIVLNENQIYRGMGKVIESAGFKEVYSWINPNSRNECHLFVLTKTEENRQ